MAKQIIILDSLIQDNIKVVFWLTVPTSLQKFFSDQNATSAYLDATAGEIQAIKDGQILEQITEIGVNPDVDLVKTHSVLEAEFAKRQNALDISQKYTRFGSFFENGLWTDVGGK